MPLPFHAALLVHTISFKGIPKMSTPLVVDYMVASDRDLASLEDTVKAMLREGWQPQGGVVPRPTHAIGGQHAFYQAMVKYDGPNAKPPIKSARK